MHHLKSILIAGFFFFISLFSTTLFAYPWTFEIAPYLWATNLNGRVSAGPASAHIDQDFTDLLKHLNYGGMLYASAHKDCFGLYTDNLYVSLSDSMRHKRIDVHANNNFGIFSAGISYIVIDLDWPDYQRWILEPYTGARYTTNDTKITVGRVDFKKNEHWTDPLIGIHSDYQLDRCWGTQFYTDIGGTSPSNQWSINVAALLNYQPPAWQHVKAYLGYRFLRQHYQTGQGIRFYEWNMKLFGPVLGVGFVF